jgi:hypothetical protein
MNPAPLVTIALDEYNGLLAKKDLNDRISDAFASSKTIDEVKKKIETEWHLSLQENNFIVSLKITQTA